MWIAIVILVLVVLFIAGGLLGFWKNAHSPLPKNLPPPLKDEPEDDWGKSQGKDGSDQQP